MAVGIYALAIILWVVLIMWTYNNLKMLENNKTKIIYLGLGILILSIITFIVFNISKIGIEYPKSEMVLHVRNMALLIFIPINGFIIMPYIALLIAKLEIGEIDTDKFRKKAILILLIFAIIMLLECSYLKNFQNGILNIYKMS